MLNNRKHRLVIQVSSIHKMPLMLSLKVSRNREVLRSSQISIRASDKPSITAQ
jgi:hypothetical protein